MRSTATTPPSSCDTPPSKGFDGGVRPIDRILLQILVTPLTLLTTIGGASVAFVSWGVDSNAGILLGMTGFLVGVGIVGSRAIFSWETILARKSRAERLEAWKSKAVLLERVRARLGGGKHRDDEVKPLYDELAGLYEVFDEAMRGEWSTSVLRAGVEDQLGQLFEGCAGYMEQALNLRRTASKLRSGAAPLLAQRVELLREVREALDQLAQTVTQVQGRPTGDTGELDRLRASLDAQLQAQRRIADRHPDLVRMLRETRGRLS